MGDAAKFTKEFAAFIEHVAHGQAVEAWPCLGAIVIVGAAVRGEQKILALKDGLALACHVAPVKRASVAFARSIAMS